MIASRSTLNSINPTANGREERLHAWASLHFPIRGRLLYSRRRWLRGCDMLTSSTVGACPFTFGENAMARNELVVPIRAMAIIRERILERHAGCIRGRICPLDLKVSRQGGRTRGHSPIVVLVIFRQFKLAHTASRISYAPEKIEDSARRQESPPPIAVGKDMVMRVRVQCVKRVVHRQAYKAAQGDPPWVLEERRGAFGAGVRVRAWGTACVGEEREQESCLQVHELLVKRKRSSREFFGGRRVNHHAGWEPERPP